MGDRGTLDGATTETTANLTTEAGERFYKYTEAHAANSTSPGSNPSSPTAPR